MVSNSFFVKYALAVLAIFTTFSCSTTRYVAEDDYLLKGNVIKSDDKSFNTTLLNQCMRQQPNSKWFSLFNIPLGIYSLSGRDSTKWGNRVLRRFGEPPVVYDSLLAEKSCQDMVSSLHAMGYLRASADYKVTKKNRKAFVSYEVKPGEKFWIDSVNYIIEDSSLIEILDFDDLKNRGLKRGMEFSSNNLDSERKRIASILNNEGFYKFNKDFIHFEADSIGKGNKVDLTLRLLKYRSSNNSEETEHKKYLVKNVTFSSGDGNRIPIRNKVLYSNTAITPGTYYRAEDVKSTYNNFARLQAVRFTSIHFDENPDTTYLDCEIRVSTRKPNTISFQPEGTNTAGDFGAAASLTYENNNIFRGSELLSIQLRGAYEAITGLEGYQNQNYKEYNIETRLTFPRIIAPFLSRSFKRRNTMKSELLFSYNMQNRPEFHRRVLSGAWRYNWRSNDGRSAYRFDLVDINYVHMPWISSTFKKEYLDDVSNRNSILRYNYEDLFILRTGLSFSYNNRKHAIRTNIEIGGNLLSAVSHLLKSGKNENGQYSLFNIAFAQYIKGDFDYTRLVMIDSKNTLALHCGIGIAYPYGNSNILPFEKRYFSGGANSVRGWNVRELGPGKFRGTDGRIDFINQTGDMKLDLNMELRTFLFWKFNGAFFIDAGNIWTIKNYKDQPGGQFKFTEFYKQIAMAYGLGIRLNFDYFVMRFDFGMKAVNPVYDNIRQHYPILHPNFGRDLSVHFAVGMPF